MAFGRQLFLKAVSTLATRVGLSDPRLYQFFGGGPTYAGETVSISSAMQLDTVWACVRLISQTISTLPLPLYERAADGYGVKAPDHPLYPILHDKPNADMVASTFWQVFVASILLWGNGYAAIERRGDGYVTSLTPMMPDRLTIERQSDQSILYIYRWQGYELKLTEDQVFHVKGFTLDGMTGLSPISQAREQLGLAMAAEKSAGSFFRNGMRPSAVMVAPSFLSDKQRATFNEDFKEKFQGTINAGKVPLLEGGFKLETLQMNPDDAQLLATRMFSIETICRWYGVPPPLVGHMEKATAWGTGLEQMKLWYLTLCLRPYLLPIEQTIPQLLPPGQRRQFYAEFNVEGLLRADSQGRAVLTKTMFETGQATPNELRALDNKPPLEGGDDLYVPSNFIPARLAGKAAEQAAQPPGPPAIPAPADQLQTVH